MPETRDFASEIAAAESVLKARLREMDPLKTKVVDAAVQYLKGWYAETVEGYVKRDFKHTASLGPRLSEMKAAVNALVDATDQRARAALSAPPLWWHERDDRSRGPMHFREWVDARPLSDRLRLEAGRLAPLLRQFGYVSAEDRTWTDTGEGARYAYGMAFPPALVAAAAQYGDALETAAEADAALTALQVAKSQQEAKDLWGKA